MADATTNTTKRFRTDIRRAVSSITKKISKAVTINAGKKKPIRELEIGDPEVFTFMHNRHLRAHPGPANSAHSATQVDVRSAALEAALPRRNTEPSLRPDLLHEIVKHHQDLRTTRAALENVLRNNCHLRHESEMLRLQLERAGDLVTTNRALRREMSEIRNTSKGNFRAEIESLRADRHRLGSSDAQLRNTAAIIRQTNELLAGLEVFILALLARVQSLVQGQGGDDVGAAQ